MSLIFNISGSSTFSFWILVFEKFDSVEFLSIFKLWEILSFDQAIEFVAKSSDFNNNHFSKNHLGL